jgi:hypothetical protein
MQPTMIITMTSAGSGLRPVKISLPRVDALVAEYPGKYALPPENPPKPQEVEHRPLRARIDHSGRRWK